MRCSKCGKFCKDVVAIQNGLEEIVEVTGMCAVHGKVEIKDWDWEDFNTEVKDE